MNVARNESGMCSHDIRSPGVKNHCRCQSEVLQRDRIVRGAGGRREPQRRPETVSASRNDSRRESSIRCHDESTPAASAMLAYLRGSSVVVRANREFGTGAQHSGIAYPGVDAGAQRRQDFGSVLRYGVLERKRRQQFGGTGVVLLEHECLPERQPRPIRPRPTARREITLMRDRTGRVQIGARATEHHESTGCGLSRNRVGDAKFVLQERAAIAGQGVGAKLRGDDGDERVGARVIDLGKVLRWRGLEGREQEKHRTPGGCGKGS